MTPRDELACHEAGHAVIALVLDIAIEYATVEPNDTSAGHVQPAVDLRSVPMDSVVVFLLAGGVATRYRFLGSSGLDAGDISRARTFLRAMHFDLSTASVDRVVNEALAAWTVVTQVYVRQHYRWIERVAAQLEARGRLSGDEIRALKPSIRERPNES